MKIFRPNFPSPMTALCAIGLLAPCLVAVNAQAATTTGTFSVQMTVNSPVCTVGTTNATVTLPTGTSQSQTLGQYLTANSITTTGQFATSSVTGPSLNQTATITCVTASVPITSFVVQPAVGAKASYLAPTVAYLTDAATPPNIAGANTSTGAGDLLVAYEQVTVNGTPAAWSYVDPTTFALKPYVGGFSTTNAANGTATVVWRPSFSIGSSSTPLSSTTAMGAATGGSFSSPGTITVNY